MSHFSLSIRAWFRQNGRQLPWRETDNPYFIWLSEVILQQTRVDQGKAYYIKFTETFPTIERLAQADEQEILKLWQGLGYYSRARNLHYAAKQVMEEFDGVFPSHFASIKSLKGVGDYTAAAVASFAFQEPKAVVDGNVYRVLSRYFNDATPIDSIAGKKTFQAYANELLDKQFPAEHNQSIMEIGALVCTPKQPNCLNCPLNDSCQAFREENVLELPVKSKKTKTRNRYFNYLVTNTPTYLLEKRTTKDIWQNLYQFPLIESENALKPEEISLFIHQQFSTELHHKSFIYYAKHILSHQHIHTYFWQIKMPTSEIINKLNLKQTSDFSDFPLPRVIDRFLEEYILKE